MLSRCRSNRVLKSSEALLLLLVLELSKDSSLFLLSLARAAAEVEGWSDGVAVAES